MRGLSIAISLFITFLLVIFFIWIFHFLSLSFMTRVLIALGLVILVQVVSAMWVIKHHQK